MACAHAHGTSWVVCVVVARAVSSADADNPLGGKSSPASESIWHDGNVLEFNSDALPALAVSIIADTD